MQDGWNKGEGGVVTADGTAGAGRGQTMGAGCRLREHELYHYRYQKTAGALRGDRLNLDLCLQRVHWVHRRRELRV